MTKYRILLIFLSFVFIYTISCSTDNSNNTVTQRIGPNGGSITSKDGLLRLDIPAGALDEDTEISIRKINNDEVEEEITDGEIEGAYELLPDGLNFNLPVNVSAILIEEPIKEDGTISTPLVLLFLSSNSGVELVNNLNTVIDTELNMTSIEGEINHFSRLTKTVDDGIEAVLENYPREVIPEVEFNPTFKIIDTTLLTTITEVILVETVFEDIFSLMDFTLPFFEVCDNDENTSCEQFTFMPQETVGENKVEAKQDLSYICRCPQETGCPTAGGVTLIARINGQYLSSTLDEFIDLDIFETLFKQVTKCLIPEINEPEIPLADPEPEIPEEQPENRSGCADVSGDYNIQCDLIIDPFGISPNFGDPYNAFLKFNLEQRPDGTFILDFENPDDPNFLPHQGTAVDQPDGSCRINAEASGNAGGGNIDSKAEDWEIRLSGSDYILWGNWRLNFQNFPSNQDSTIYDCNGLKQIE